MSTQDLNRRKFVRISALTAAAGITVLAANFGIQRVIGNIKTRNLKIAPKDTKELFKKYGACSHLYAHILNREFGQNNDAFEFAADPLAGGIMKGYQCGMLWGCSLAIGSEAFRKYGTQSMAVSAAINATGEVMNSFVNLTGSPNCRDVSKVDFQKKSGMISFMAQAVLHGGMKNTSCFNLAEKWAPVAIENAKRGLATVNPDVNAGCLSCATEVVRKMGGTDEEMITVAGLAGGMGLKGHACGALGAAVWMNKLPWCKKNPGKMALAMEDQKVAEIYGAFEKASKLKVNCREISGTLFQTSAEHSEYIRNGGCSEIINTLAEAAKS